MNEIMLGDLTDCLKNFNVLNEKNDITLQHIAKMSMCCEVISSFVIFAVLVLRFCCSRPYKML